MQRLKHQRLRQERRGFTLIELMVVISLILLLLSISIAGLRGAVGIARVRATQATILKVHGLVQQRVDAFNRTMDRLDLTLPRKKLWLDFNLTTGQATNVLPTQNLKLWDVLVRKQLFQSRFPQNFSEFSLAGQPTFNAAKHNQITESAALLYWLLTSSEVFGVPPVDASDFNSSEVRDTDGDGLLEFVDAWGNPLRFYRWPTQLIRLGGGTSSVRPAANPTMPNAYVSLLWSGLPPAPPTDGNGNAIDIDPLMRDPDDPTAQLSLLVLQDGSGTILQLVEGLFGTPSTYHAYLIASAGPDGKLGLGEPFDYWGTSTVSPGIPNPTPAAPPSVTTTSPTFTLRIAASTMPTTGTYQGRLAAPDPYYSATSIVSHPINDNLTNRKK